MTAVGHGCGDLGQAVTEQDDMGLLHPLLQDHLGRGCGSWYPHLQELATGGVVETVQQVPGNQDDSVKYASTPQQQVLL